MAIRPKYEFAAGHEMSLNSTFIFINTNWKLIIEEKTQVVDRHLVVNVSHDNVDMHNLARFEQLARAHCPAGRLYLVHFVVKNGRRKSGFREDLYAGDFLMVHQF